MRIETKLGVLCRRTNHADVAFDANVGTKRRRELAHEARILRPNSGAAIRGRPLCFACALLRTSIG